MPLSLSLSKVIFRNSNLPENVELYQDQLKDSRPIPTLTNHRNLSRSKIKDGLLPQGQRIHPLAFIRLRIIRFLRLCHAPETPINILPHIFSFCGLTLSEANNITINKLDSIPHQACPNLIFIVNREYHVRLVRCCIPENMFYIWVRRCNSRANTIAGLQGQNMHHYKRKWKLTAR